LSQKQQANLFVDISAESYARIKNWDSKASNNKALAESSFFFQGPETADIFILDSEGGFFKGDSGALLKRILGAMTLAPDAVFICNTGDIPAVHQKIKTISPKIIITLGRLAGQALLGLDQPLEKFRGKFHQYYGIRVMPTFHPSFLLEQPQYKRQVWEDMKQVMEAFGFGHGS
jgi:DNA polymerase